MDQQIHKLFISQSTRYITMSKERIIKCLNMVDDDQIWYCPNENSNSIGNLVLHLSGNIKQYIISGLGEEKDERKRSEEFIKAQAFTRQELLQKIDDIISKAIQIIEGVNVQKLNRTYSIQGFSLSGLEVILHVTEHLSYHTGQIALLTKILENKDLGFYDGMDLNITN